MQELSIIRDVVFSRLIRENRIDSGQNEKEEEIPFESITTEEIPIGDGREQAANGEMNLIILKMNYSDQLFNLKIKLVMKLALG